MNSWQFSVSLSLQLVWENSFLFVSYSVICGSTSFSVISHAQPLFQLRLLTQMEEVHSWCFCLQ